MTATKVAAVNFIVIDVLKKIVRVGRRRQKIFGFVF
jgi:hypothetical protein